MDAAKNFYVGIQNSKDFRRNLLESSKTVVSILKRYHKIKAIRLLKKEKLKILKNHLDDITKLVNHLDDAMPDMGIRATAPKAQRVVPLEQVKVPVAKSHSDLDKLEAQLKEIDARLNNI